MKSIGKILKDIFTGSEGTDVFVQCLEIVLEHEGGFVDHPRDPGGATNLGITKRTYEEWVGREVSVGEIRRLTIEDVVPIYREKYWEESGADRLPNGINLSVFDWAVNTGPPRAKRFLQKELKGVTIDGVIGPKTLAAVQAEDQEMLINRYHHRRQMFYQRLRHFDAFGRGWTRRNQETLEYAQDLLFYGEIF